MTDGTGSPATEITSDNIHLSEVIPDCLQWANGGNCNPLSIRDHTDRKVLELVAAATAANTRRAYESDVRHFQRWGGVIPATDELVARYLADHAGVLAIATLARRLVAIRSAHIGRGLVDPTKSELVRLVLRGIRRRHGRPQHRVAALSADDLFEIIRSLGPSTKDIRDAAILLVGFAGAFRRSELASIDLNDIGFGQNGLSIRLCRSKTDQDGRGRKVSIPRLGSPICPVNTMEQWLSVSKIKEGAVFRPVTKGGKIVARRISPEAIACLVKSCVRRIGRDPRAYSGHSLRAGFATEAARLSVPMLKIRAQTGHTSDFALEKYIRESEVNSANIFRMIAAATTG